VAVGAVPPGRAPGDALALEAGGLQRLLLGDVGGLGVRLDAIDRGVPEDQVGEPRLRRGADAAAPVFGPEPDADHRTPGPGGGTPLLPVPADVAGHLAVVGEHGQRAVAVEPGGLGRVTDPARAEVVVDAFPARQQGQIVRLLRAQRHVHRTSMPGLARQPPPSAAQSAADGRSIACVAWTATSTMSPMLPPSSTVVAMSSRRPPSIRIVSWRDGGATPAARNSGVVLRLSMSVMNDSSSSRWRWRASEPREGRSLIQLSVMGRSDSAAAIHAWTACWIWTSHGARRSTVSAMWRTIAPLQSWSRAM